MRAIVLKCSLFTLLAVALFPTNSGAVFDLNPMFESYTHLSQGAINELFYPECQNQFLSFDKLKVLKHPQANWSCNVFFGMDSKRGQFLVLHQEGSTVNPSSFYHCGKVGSAVGEFYHPKDFCVAGEYGGEGMQYSAVYNVYPIAA